MRYHRWPVYAALCALLNPLCCLEGQEPGTIRGRVLQKESGSPIAEAVATLKETGASARTAVTGRFTLSNIAAGDYTLIVTALGQLPSQLRVSVRSGQTSEVDVQMT